mmetsp:Transcript_21906/g.33427  ORF Transcript_21906/g.33427 Transcript_21906/m.33427 type:complete len:229 (-) Transcript_21906:161-847(-)
MIRTMILSIALILSSQLPTILGHFEFSYAHGTGAVDEEDDRDRRDLQLFKRIRGRRAERLFTSWQNSSGTPDFDWSVGCSIAETGAGNPADLVHCFDKTLPLLVGGVRFFLGSQRMPTSTLKVKVWSSDLFEELYSQDVDDYAIGENTVIFEDGAVFVGSVEDRVCVGVGGDDLEDSFFLTADENPETRNNSYAMASVCGAGEFAVIGDLIPQLENITWNFQLVLGNQ